MDMGLSTHHLLKYSKWSVSTILPIRNLERINTHLWQLAPVHVPAVAWAWWVWWPCLWPGPWTSAGCGSVHWACSVGTVPRVSPHSGTHLGQCQSWETLTGGQYAPATSTYIGTPCELHRLPSIYITQTLNLFFNQNIESTH